MGFNGKGWRYIEDAITATEKALDDALWDGLDTPCKEAKLFATGYTVAEYLERELAGLRAAQAAGEKYDTDW